MKLSSFLALLAVLLMSASIAQTQPVERKFTRQEYIDQYKSMAVKEMLQSGVPASITLSQGILESGDGNSMLAQKANNHFGIKCHGQWNGEKFYMDDDSKGECFRVYESVFDSYKDHSEFLRTRDRYSDLFKLERTDYKGWAHGLKKAGYATNPKYPDLLIKIIEENDLHQYDGMNSAPNEPKKVISQEEKPKPRRGKLANESEFTVGMGSNIHTSKNRIKYIVAHEGSTFESFERNFDIRKWQLTRYNDLKDNHKFTEGEIVYLQPKRGKAQEEFHIVVMGETMRDISQQHGIKLKKLYRKNRMEPGTQPVAGQKLYLRKNKPGN